MIPRPGVDAEEAVDKVAEPYVDRVFVLSSPLLEVPLQVNWKLTVTVLTHWAQVDSKKT